MRQIGTATRLYMQNYDEQFPQTKMTDAQPQIDDADVQSADHQPA